jgi:hypothetical protein
MAAASGKFSPTAGYPQCYQRRARLLAMDDAMLARWGASAAYMCKPEANLGAQPRQVFAVQLREARAEWRRRHPKGSPVEEGPHKVELALR